MVLPELQTGEDEDWYVKLADLGPTQLVCMGHYCPLACMHAHKERQRILNTQPHTQKKTHVWCTGIFVAPISLRTMCSHTPQLPKEQQKVLGHCHRDRIGQDRTAQLRHPACTGEYMQEMPSVACSCIMASCSWVHGLVSSRLAICIASSVTLYGCTGCLLQVAQLW